MLSAVALGANPAAVKTAWASQDDATGLKGVTAVSASALRDSLRSALSLARDAPVKVSMLPDAASIETSASELARHSGTVVADPVMGPSSGGSWAGPGWLEAYRKHMPRATDLLTPNLAEARALAGKDGGDARQCAESLAQAGFGTLVITGGDDKGKACADLVYAEGKARWLLGERLPGTSRGTGCAHSTSVSAALACGESMQDAIVIGRMQATAKVAGSMRGWPSMAFLPRLADSPTLEPASGTRLKGPAGVWALIDKPSRIDDLADAGVRSFQLRVKDAGDATVASLVLDACERAREHGARLFVNDHWKVCCDLQDGTVDGVHLGQDDLRDADLKAIRSRGLAIGVSANGWAEAAAALAAGPAYVSFGPVFPTRSKETTRRTVGVRRLGLLCNGLPIPALAIGGITPERVGEVAQAGASGIAAIEACSSPEAARRLVSSWKEAQASQR